MEIINLSKQRFNSLEKLVLSSDIFNNESEFYRFSYRGVDMILKKISASDDLAYYAKLDTIQLLNEYASSMPRNFVIPKFLVSIDNKTEFFVLPYVSGKNLSQILKDDSISYMEKKYYLIRIGHILEQMKAIRASNESLKNFYLGDLHEDNFIVNLKQRELYVIDLDSAKTSSRFSPLAKYLSHVTLLNYVDCKYNVDIENVFFTSYKADENTDLYCYIIMILNYLYGEKINEIDINDYYEYLNYLDDLNFDKNLLGCFERIVSNGDNINPVPYLDSLTARQISMARKRFYISKR